jgi:hypothetical protein
MCKGDKWKEEVMDENTKEVIPREGIFYIIKKIRNMKYVSFKKH